MGTSPSATGASSPGGVIKVSSKTLAHISRGLYRSTAGALKELVSNAYDANAKQVTITTNPPNFSVITCQDDGDGWTVQKFTELMEGGIGDSDKRQAGDFTPVLGRPIIGRIGIGLLAVAQICYEFEIWSHHAETRSAFHGTVHIRDTLDAELDSMPSSPDEEQSIGTYYCEDVPYQVSQNGTRIVVTDVKRGFTLKHRISPADDGGQAKLRVRPPRCFQGFLDEVYSERTIATFGQYWELLWGLSVQCPIDYLADGPFIIGAVSGDTELVTQYLTPPPTPPVRLVVDSVELRKPVLLPNIEGGQRPLACRVHYFEMDETVQGQPLRVRGYFLGQAKAVKPSELRGLLVRVRGVGIGGYDKTFLDYSQWSAGPRLQQVTGELYVEEGLEDALNIDRDSFNEMHPHYLALQRRVHDELTGVFKSLTAESRRRASDQTRKIHDERRQRLLKRASEIAGRDYTVLNAPPEQERLVVIDRRKRRIYAKNEVAWTGSKKKSAQAIDIAIAAAIADAEHPGADEVEARFSTFTELLREVL